MHSMANSLIFVSYRDIMLFCLISLNYRNRVWTSFMLTFLDNKNPFHTLCCFDCDFNVRLTFLVEID